VVSLYTQKIQSKVVPIKLVIFGHIVNVILFCEPKHFFQGLIVVLDVVLVNPTEERLFVTNASVDANEKTPGYHHFPTVTVHLLQIVALLHHCLSDE